MHVEDFFDELAPDWDNDPDGYELREKLTKLMDIPTNSIIADIGCGKGVMLEHLLKTDPSKIIATDISGEMLRFAKELYNDPRIQYVHGDFLATQTPNLDVAVIFNAYPHFMDKGSLAKKLAQTIKTGGLLIIAHSFGREVLNEMHTGEAVSKFSTCLEAAEIEAVKFQNFFNTELLVDNEEMYFIKMRRNTNPL